MKDTRREKGLKFQKWVKDWLKELGWTVHNQKPVGRMLKIKDKKTKKIKTIYVSQRNDILGCIDLVAKKENKPTLWIQATLHTGVGEKKKALQTVPWGKEDMVQVWVKREDGHVDIFMLGCDSLHLIGKIIRRKFYKGEYVVWEF